jgi:2-methylisocitrate lyase-like PEP mutase family enzyme
MNVRRFVRELERAGVAGTHLEDTLNPKHMYENDVLTSIDQMRSRLAAAREATRDDDFVIIARTDELFNKGSVEEAIRRGVAYAEEGADAYFCLSMTPEQIEVIKAEVPIPLVDINQPIDVAQKAGLGVDIFTGATLSFLVSGFRQMLKEIQDSGRIDFGGSATRHYEYVKDLLDDDQWMPVGRHWVEHRDVVTKK